MKMKRFQLGDGENVLASAEIELVFFLVFGIMLWFWIYYENDVDITLMV